jgi:hypothetical protein
MSGKTAYSDPQYVYQTLDNGIGWITYAGFEGKGVTWDFVNNKGIETSYFDCNNWPLHDVDEGGDGDGYIYKTTVYNIEVEDYHTYFVGEHGVWVHNANCFGSANL